jgi:hypothetical protein
MGSILVAMTRGIWIFGLVLAVLGVTAAANAAGRRPVVVELYTSQGCGSCPPADALLGRLAERHDVIAMSLPVTYWDMLGWKDTLASDANTSRQKAYALAKGRGGVYTPQMIVDGASDVVGSREADVQAAIAEREADMPYIPVTLQTTRNAMHIAIGAGDSGANATIWLFHLLDRANVDVASGENGGRVLTYRNVVREVRAIGLWRGHAVAIDLPRTEVANVSHDSVAVIVQDAGYGRILGAAQTAWPGR